MTSGDRAMEPEDENQASNGYDQLDDFSLRYDSKQPPKQYIDWLVSDRHVIGGRDNHHMIIKRNERYVNSSNIAFFSESRVKALGDRLGHDRVQQLLDTLESVIETRLIGRNQNSEASIGIQSSVYPAQESSPEHPRQSAGRYIKSYFDQIHPIYPFLDREAFEAKASAPDLADQLKSDTAWCALYFTILALGSQYHNEGNFDPGKGKPWRLFQIALSKLPELQVPEEALPTVQALTAMVCTYEAIFALNISCLQIEELLVSEAARTAMAMDLNKCTGSRPSDVESQRTFWVIYGLEKEQCFRFGRPSIIADYDIGCPIPQTPPGPMLANLDWMFLYSKYSRILSKAYQSLFSISATLSSDSEYFDNIDRFRRELAAWKDSLPPSLRPGNHPPRFQNFENPASKLLFLHIHHSYYHSLISLARLTLHICKDKSLRLSEAKSTLMQSARSIIDLTQYTDIAPHTPTWILGILPLVALFILFDFVTQNPNHPATRKNLGYLDIAAGYFTRLEFATEGSLPSSLLAEFTHIARQYVREIENRGLISLTTEVGQPTEFQYDDQAVFVSAEDNMIPSLPNLAVDNTGSSSPLYHLNVPEAASNSMGEFGGLDITSMFGAQLPDLLDSSFAFNIDSILDDI